MSSRLFCALLIIAPLALHAQSPAPGGAANQKRGRGAGGGGANANFAPVSIPAAPDAATLAEGKKIFELHCAPCHGPNGEGQRGPTLAQPSLPRATDDAALIRIIRGGIAGTEMPAAHLQAPQIPVVAAYVKALGQLPVERVPGDPAKGAQLFQTKGACAQCHTLNGQGGIIGPDLTDIGRRRSAAYLRRSLADPNADVPQSYTPYRAEINLPLNFLYVRAVTRDKQTIAGVRVNEDTFSIQLRDLTGKMHSYLKSELAELHKDWGQSPMPPYIAVFTPAEMDDIVSYLVSLRGDSK